MLRLVLIFFLTFPHFAGATDKVITSIEDKKTLMGVFELSLDVGQSEAIEIAKLLKQEMSIDQIAVRQISSRRYGVAIQTKYEGGEKAMDSILEKAKVHVTKKFGKNTIASWSMSGTIYLIQ